MEFREAKVMFQGGTWRVKYRAIVSNDRGISKHQGSDGDFP